MKHFYTSLLFSLLSTLIYAQCRVDGTNVITTNPANTVWPIPPYNLPFKKNTFDWRQHYFNTIPAFSSTSTLESPFWKNNSNDNLFNIIAFADNAPLYADFNPEDGWELIRRDFGFKADGSLSPQRVGPYFILYNRFSGTLRVLAYLANTSSYQVVNVKLSFGEGRGENPSGIFAHYNTDGSRAMDQNTIVKSISTPAQSGGNQLIPIFADFQLAYDPCTCLFNSALKVSFETVQTLKIDLYGKVLATSQPISSFDKDNNISQYKDYLTSVYSDPLDPYKVKAGMITYSKLNDFYTDYQNSADKAANSSSLKLGLDILKTALQVGAAVATDGVSEEAKAAFKLTRKNGLESAGILTDFFSSLLGDGSGDPLPSVIAGEMALVGNAKSVEPVNGNSVVISNPGSKDSQNAPECCGSDPNGTHPEQNTDYPMYNEVLGVFALLKTPTATIVKNSVDYGVSKKKLQLNSPLEYVINPAVKVNLANSRIYASIEVEQSDAVAPDVNYWPFTDMVNNQSNLFYRYKSTASADLGGRTKLVSTSPTLPIESINNIPIMLTDLETWHFPTWNTTYKLSIMLDLEFQDLNKAGVPNRTLTVLTYPINISSETYTNTYLDGTFIQESFTLSPINFTSNQTINAWNDITIAGGLTANTGVTGTIAAGGNTIVQAGISIGPGVTLKAGVSPISFDYTLRPKPSSYVTSFCGNGTYKANSPAAREVSSSDTIKTIKKDQEFFTFYPNPANSQVTFNYFLEEPTSVALGITDISGKRVATIVQAEQEMDDYSLTYDTSGLPPGVYIVTFQTNKIYKTEKLIVIR